MLGETLKMAAGLTIVAAIGGSFLSQQTSGNPSQQIVSPSLLAQFMGNATRTVGSAPPLQARPVGFGRVELKPDSGGQYHAEVEIEGRRIPMLVDTGATLVTLTFADARRLGLAPAPSDFTANVNTANGPAKAARLLLREVRVDNLLVPGVPALVMPEPVVGTSLLGMSFLQRLGGFEVASGNLVLRP